MSAKRDPRHDPRSGDRLREDGDRIVVIVPASTPEDLAAWRKRMKNAEVIHCAD